ncbi:hypothetical protein BJY01DRAFT_219561 [Aspergillus pseudoustus]|uniref:BZIP domain-containing protein n=1 Tax=Aspergillus pseudoustus TaxID=1810923 RepID=A0ABR4JG20_9EURO
MDSPLPSDTPLFSWGDFHPNPPVLPESETSEITSLLSARSYLLPEPYSSQNEQSSLPAPSPGDLRLDLASSGNLPNTIPSPLYRLMTPRLQENQRRERKKAASRKDLQVRRKDGYSKENPEERRRIQSRIAQRAYRERQQAVVDGLKNQVSVLEISIERMSSAMLAFSERLVQSGLLKAHAALTANLRDTMKTFLSIAVGTSHDDEIIFSVEPNKRIESVSAPRPATSKHPSPHEPLHLPLDGPEITYPNSTTFPYDVDPPENSILEVSAFIQKLLHVALYHGHLALRDPSIGFDQLQRPFGLVFSMMSRARLTSYFKAELNAHVSQKPLDGWDEVPFFRLGGAGTHYPPHSSNAGGSFVPHSYQSGGTVEDPLSLVAADLRTQLEGDWFDLQDLEGYIREKDVRLVVSAAEPTKGSKVQSSINVSRFMTTLVSRGVCLGRTPGFQRKDVEYALNFSKV